MHFKANLMQVEEVRPILLYSHEYFISSFNLQLIFLSYGTNSQYSHYIALTKLFINTFKMELMICLGMILLWILLPKDDTLYPLAKIKVLAAMLNLSFASPLSAGFAFVNSFSQKPPSQNDRVYTVLQHTVLQTSYTIELVYYTIIIYIFLLRCSFSQMYPPVMLNKSILK